MCFDVIACTLQDDHSNECLRNIQGESRANVDPDIIDAQLSVIELLTPTSFYFELPVPDVRFNKLDHFKHLEESVYDLGYSVATQTVKFSEHGDFTDRERFFLVATRPDTHFSFPPALPSFKGLSPCLRAPKVVAPCDRTPYFCPLDVNSGLTDFDAHVMGTVSKGRSVAVDCDKLHDPHYPLSSIGDYHDYSRINGGQWALDEIGPRKLTIREQARVHNPDSDGLAFLVNQRSFKAQGYIARSTPVAFMSALYESMLESLRHQAKALTSKELLASSEFEATLERIAVHALGADIVSTFPTLDELAEAQHEDEQVEPLFAYLESDKSEGLLPQGPYAKIAPYLLLNRGVIFYRDLLGDNEILTDAVLVPEALRKQVLYALHDSPYSGHAGIRGTLQAVRERAYWPRLVRDVKQYVKNCLWCTKARAHQRTHAGKSQHRLHTQALEEWAFDTVGPFKRGKNGETNILHGTCAATGWNITAVLKSKEAAEVADAIHKNVVLVYGWPKVILSDNGTEYCNKIAKELFDQYGVKHIRTTPYHPKGNAYVENRHRRYNEVLKIAVKQYRMSWVTAVPFITWCLNTRPYRGTQISPYELLFSRRPPSFADAVLEDGHAAVSIDKVVLPDAEYHKMAKQRVLEARAVVERAKIDVFRENDIATEKQRYTIVHRPGDLVFVHRPVAKKGQTSRLLFQCAGPFEVMAHASPPNEDGSYNVYRLRNLRTAKMSTHNIKDIHPYISKEAYVEYSDDVKALKTLAGQDVSADDDIAVNDNFDPQQNDFLLFPGFETVDYHLIQVTKREGDMIHFHYLNTSGSSRLKNFKPVWTAPGKSKEIQSMTKPRLKGYELVEHQVPIDEVCQQQIFPIQTPIGYNLTKSNVEAVLKYLPASA